MAVAIACPWSGASSLVFVRLQKIALLPARLEKGFIRVPAAELQETDDAIHLNLWNAT
ncbi:hypothetical protein [uncultured Nostoc sp.]|uniref:hypothetical protein n=1 Tax=uncultured Nostoc sp. TaxID=340711 RepID=UPI0035CA4B9C